METFIHWREAPWQAEEQSLHLSVSVDESLVGDGLMDGCWTSDLSRNLSFPQPPSPPSPGKPSTHLKPLPSLAKHASFGPIYEIFCIQTRRSSAGSRLAARDQSLVSRLVTSVCSASSQSRRSDVLGELMPREELAERRDVMLLQCNQHVFPIGPSTCSLCAVGLDE